MEQSQTERAKWQNRHEAQKVVLNKKTKKIQKK